jgi:hypothetical protein
VAESVGAEGDDNTKPVEEAEEAHPIHQEQCALVEESVATPETEESLDAEAKDESSAAMQVAEPAEHSGQEREETSPSSDAPMGFEADAAALRLDVAQEPTYTTDAADRPAKSSRQAEPLDMLVKRGLDFHVAGPPNSQQRAEFETVLVCDLSKASELKPVAITFPPKEGSELVQKVSQGSRSGEPRTPATGLKGSDQAPPSRRSVELLRICPTENMFCITVEEVQTATAGVVVEHVAAGSRQSSEGKRSWSSWLFEIDMRKCARCDKCTHKSSWKAW